MGNVQSKGGYHIGMSPASPGGLRVAFFGGSFDPPHLGHLAVARAARRGLGLDRILFAPVGMQPLKPGGPAAGFEDRVEMTRLAIAGEPAFEVSLLDSPEPGSAAPNYTADTLATLREMLPGGAQLYLLMGADSFRSLPQWHRAAEIPLLARLIVASRPGENLSNLSGSLPAGIAIRADEHRPDRYLLSNGAGEESELTVLPNLHYDVSATELRSQIQGRRGQGEPALLDAAVLGYIRRHGLYA